MKRTLFVLLLIVAAACDGDRSPTKPPSTGAIKVVLETGRATEKSIPDSTGAADRAAKPALLTRLEVRVLKSDNTVLVIETIEPTGTMYNATLTVEAQNDLRVLCLGMFDGAVGYFGIDEDVDVEVGKTTTAVIAGWTEPYLPQIGSISPNPSADGSYTVSWTAAPNATLYTLQEANNDTFAGADVVYSGSGLKQSFTGKTSGIFYYRVQASNVYNVNSSWSDTATAAVQMVIEYVLSGTITGADGVTVTLSGDASDSQAVNNGGAYSYIVYHGGTYTVTPTKDGYTFTPASWTFTNVTANQMQDFTAEAITSISGRIAFISYRDFNYDIYVMDADGSSQRNLTNNTANDEGPSWSPDGARIAFTSDRDGNREIYVMDADGSNQQRLTNNLAYDVYSYWSPDGSRIAFLSNRDGNIYIIDIYVMDADGSSQQNLTNNQAWNQDPSWSPDGSIIAFSSNRDDNSEIYVMDADGSNQQNLTNNQAWNSSPAWSPDGSRIAFLSNRDGNPEIYVMDADGSNQQNLTNNQAWNGDPSWSPDGSRIVFSSDRDGNYDIYVMDADGSNQRNLTNNPYLDYLPSWSPDGAQITFESLRDGNDEIYVMDADGSNQRRLTNNPAWDGFPSWSPF